MFYTTGVYSNGVSLQLCIGLTWYERVGQWKEKASQKPRSCSHSKQHITRFAHVGTQFIPITNPMSCQNIPNPGARQTQCVTTPYNIKLGYRLLREYAMEAKVNSVTKALDCSSVGSENMNSTVPFSSLVRKSLTCNISYYHVRHCLHASLMSCHVVFMHVASKSREDITLSCAYGACELHT